MSPTSRYLQERDDFLSRARRLVPWLTPAKLMYLAYWADTKAVDPSSPIEASAFRRPAPMLRKPELRKLGRLDRFAQEPPWVERRIPKRNGAGTRLLYVPNPVLKQLHRFVLRAHLARLDVDRVAYGFEPDRGRRKHAEIHCDKYVVMRVDIRSFFPSIELEQVENVLAECGFQSRFRNAVAHLITFRGRVPQGAPTSPKVADLVARPLDRKLRSVAKEGRWQYSRYADDLTFSHPRRRSRSEIGEMLAAVAAVVEECGFNVQPAKTRVMKRHTRQLVVGAVVNNTRPTVPREKRRRLRGILHRCRMNGLVHEAQRYWQGLKRENPKLEVEEGRYTGETIRSDQRWPYDKQIRWVPGRYLDPLIAYSVDDRKKVYDFWHYLCGQVGEVVSIDPRRGAALKRQLRELKLAHVEMKPQFSSAQRRSLRFWEAVERLTLEMTKDAQLRHAEPRLFDTPPVSPEGKLRVAESRDDFEAFTRDVYKYLYEGMTRKDFIHDCWNNGELKDLDFACAFRNTSHHLPSASDKRSQRNFTKVRKGLDRLHGPGRPETPRDWRELQQNLFTGLVQDLEFLQDWLRSEMGPQR